MGRRPVSRRFLGATTGDATTNTDPAYAIAKATTLAQLNHADAGQAWVQNAIKNGATSAQLAPLYNVGYSMVPQVAQAAGQATTAATPASTAAAQTAAAQSSFWASASTGEKVAIVAGGALAVVLVVAATKKGRR
jgi:hypothetical protein